MRSLHQTYSTTAVHKHKFWFILNLFEQSSCIVPVLVLNSLRDLHMDQTPCFPVGLD